MVVTGDFDPAVAKAETRQAFGSVPAGTQFEWKPATPPLQARASMLLIDKPDATQTYFHHRAARDRYEEPGPRHAGDHQHAIRRAIYFDAQSRNCA